MSKLLYSLILLSALCFQSSCSLQRIFKKHKTNTVNIPDTTVVVSGNGRPRIYLPLPDTVAQMPDTAGENVKLVLAVTPVYNKKITYETFSTKAKVNFEGPDDKNDFTANIRIRRDSAIWIDVYGLGGLIHAVRVLITTDSFFMINYLQRDVTKLALSQVAKVLPAEVDFQSMQHLIIGVPLRGGPIVSVSDMGSSWLLSTDDGSYLQAINYGKADSNMIAEQVNTHVANGPQALFQLERFEVVSERKLSLGRKINIQNGNDHFMLEMELQKSEFDQPVDMPFFVPNKYIEKH